MSVYLTNIVFISLEFAVIKYANVLLHRGEMPRKCGKVVVFVGCPFKMTQYLSHMTSPWRKRS